MHYEVYIDILFFTNFMMDTLLLFVVRKFLKLEGSWIRILCAGMIGAIFTCLIYIIPVKMGGKFLFCWFFFPGMMLKIAFRFRERREVIQAWFLLYASAVCMGGMLQLFRPYISKGICFFAVTLLSYGILQATWNMLQKRKEMQNKFCEVIVYRDEKRWTIQALIDTGNCLTDPISNEPVHIVDRETARLLGVEYIVDGMTFDEEANIPFRYISYRTVAGDGIMPIIRMEKMCVKLEREYWIEHPIFGIGEEILSENGMYHMILNTESL